MNGPNAPTHLKTSYYDYLSSILSITGFRLLAVIGIALVAGVFPALESIMTGMIVDSVVDTFSSSSSGTVRIFALLILYGLGQFMSKLMPGINTFYIAKAIRQAGVSTWRTILAAMRQSKSIEVYERPNSQHQISLGLQGAAEYVQTGVQGLSSLTQSTLTILLLLGVLQTIGTELALLALASALLTLPIHFSEVAGRVSFDAELNRTDRINGYYQHLAANADALTELKVNNGEKAIHDDLIQTVESINEGRTSIDFTTLKKRTFADVIPIVASVVVLLFMFLGPNRSDITPGSVTVVLTGFASLQSALGSVMVGASSLFEGKKYYEYYLQAQRLTASTPTTSPIPAQLEIDKLSAPLTTPAPSVSFENIWFRYSPELPWVLKDFSLTVPAGKTVAILGDNGSGKTTAIKLLSGLRTPERGRILADGHDISQLRQSGHDPGIGLLVQSPLQLEADLRRNIDISGQYTDRQILAAAEEAGLLELINSLDRGLSTQMTLEYGDDEYGHDFSGGEWQRVAIARLFLPSPRVVILDEPTAAMDPIRELSTLNILRNYLTGRSGILITHRLSMLHIADLVAVVADGQVAQYGTPNELLASPGPYRDTVLPQVEAHMALFGVSRV